MQRKSLHGAAPAAGIAGIPDVPGWLLGTQALAAQGQPSGAEGSDVWSPHSTHHLPAQLGDEGFPIGMEEGMDPHLHYNNMGWQPGDPGQPPPPPPAGCSMGAILPPPPRHRLVPPGEGAAAGARGWAGGSVLGAKGSTWQGHGIYMVMG